MEKIKNIIKWLVRNFFFIVITIFILTYIRSFWLRPNPIALTFTLIWVLVNIFIVVVFRIVTSRTCFGKFILVILLFFFVVNAWSIQSMLKVKVVDFAKHNGATYYIVKFPVYLEPHTVEYGLTKWYGFLKHDSRGNWWPGIYEISYDEEMDLVSVVKMGRLVYSDSTPPRYYDDYNEVEFNGKKYSLAQECHPNPLRHNICETFTYMIYQCELDHTSCMPFSFQYDGYVFEMNIDNGSEPNEINVYFVIEKYLSEEVLIFTQGETPRCHVAGCKILSQP